MSDNIQEPMTDEEIHYCEKHPKRDTELRCNRCGRYMCIDCAVRTPVGYTCKECVRGHEQKFFKGTVVDYAIVAVVSAIGGAVGGFIISLIGEFFLFAVIAAPAIGGSVSQLALTITGRRRGRYTSLICAGGLLVGGLAIALFYTGLDIFTLLYLALAVPAAYGSAKVWI